MFWTPSTIGLIAGSLTSECFRASSKESTTGIKAFKIFSLPNLRSRSTSASILFFWFSHSAKALTNLSLSALYLASSADNWDFNCSFSVTSSFGSKSISDSLSLGVAFAASCGAWFSPLVWTSWAFSSCFCSLSWASACAFQKPVAFVFLQSAFLSLKKFVELTLMNTWGYAK